MRQALDALARLLTDGRVPIFQGQSGQAFKHSAEAG